jgi:hypothetical protein
MPRTFADSSDATYGLRATIQWEITGTGVDGCSLSGSGSWPVSDDVFSDLAIREWARTGGADTYGLSFLLRGPGRYITRNYPHHTDEVHISPLAPVDRAQSGSRPWTPGSTSVSGSRSYRSRTDGPIDVT